MSGNLTNLGYSAQTKNLFCDTIYFNPANTDGLTEELPIHFINNGIRETNIDTSGNISTLGSFQLNSGTNLNSPYTSTLNYTIHLDANNDFEIYDNVNNTWRIRINASTGQTTFNPPLGSSSLTVANVDGTASSFYPTFLPTSSSGSTGTLDVASTIYYNPSTNVLVLPNVTPTNIIDSTGSTGSSGQVLTRGTIGFTWTTPSATNLAGGTANAIPYQSAPSTTTFLSPSTAGSLLTTNGSGSAPTWTSQSSIVAGIANNIASLGVTNNQVYYIPMLSSYASSSGQPVYTDSNGHLTFNPSTNQLVAQGIIISNGGYTMNGSASQLLINNNSSTIPAISAPNAVTISFPSANVIAKNLTSTTITDGSSSVGSSGYLLSSTGTGLSWVNPSSITTGNVNITNSTSSATLYPTFVSSTGSQAVDIDNASGHFTYQPSTGTLTTLVLDCPTINGGSSTTINGGQYNTDIITNTSYGTINLKAGTTSYFSLTGGLGSPYLSMTPSLTSSLNTNCVIPFLGGTTLGKIYADSSTSPLTYNPSTTTLTTNILQTPTINAGAVALTIQGGSSAPINTYFGSSTGGAFNVRAGTPSSYTDVFNIAGGIGLNAVSILPQSATGSTSSYKVPIISPSNVFSNDGTALNYLPSTQTFACPNLIVSGSVSIGGNPSFQLYGYTNNAYFGTYTGQQVLVQMGYYSGTTNTSAKLAVNFPTPFPNGVMKITLDNNVSSSSATTIYEDYYVGGTATLSGFTVSAWVQSTSGGTRTYRTSQSITGYYTAYGW